MSMQDMVVFGIRLFGIISFTVMYVAIGITILYLGVDWLVRNIVKQVKHVGKRGE